MDYYFADGDQQKGPFPPEALRGQGLRPDSLVWREGMSSWERADSLADLRDLFGGEAAGGAAPSPAGGFDSPAPASSPQSFPSAPQYTPAPAAYGSPSYPAPSYGPPAASGYAGSGYAGSGYAAPGQQLSYGGYVPAGGTPPTGLAIASMILGIVAIPGMFLYCVGIPCGILAIVLGHVARSRIRKGQAGGSGMALAGLICGYASMLLLVAGILFFAVIISASGARHH